MKRRLLLLLLPLFLFASGCGANESGTIEPEDAAELSEVEGSEPDMPEADADALIDFVLESGKVSGSRSADSKADEAESDEAESDEAEDDVKVQADDDPEDGSDSEEVPSDEDGTEESVTDAEEDGREDIIFQEIEPREVWVSASDVNLRESPDTDSDVLERLRKRTSLTELAYSDEWIKVSYGDVTGYVYGEYITDEEPVSTGNGYVVCIDPGHQLKGDSTGEPNGPGSDTMKARVTSGTKGTTTGVSEYVLNLDIGLALRDELEARGYTVVMTRETHDVNISNMERAKFATDHGADITVRIHANGADSSSVNGALVMVPSSSNPYVSYLAGESERLGRCIIDHYCDETGLKNDGLQATDNMTGINWCTCPVVIIEMGFMTNPSDDTNMQDPAFQVKMVDGIADGIDAYYE